MVMRLRFSISASSRAQKLNRFSQPSRNAAMSSSNADASRIQPFNRSAAIVLMVRSLRVRALDVRARNRRDVGAGASGASPNRVRRDTPTILARCEGADGAAAVHVERANQRLAAPAHFMGDARAGVLRRISNEDDRRTAFRHLCAIRTGDVPFEGRILVRVQHAICGREADAGVTSETLGPAAGTLFEASAEIRRKALPLLTPDRRLRLR